MAKRFRRGRHGPSALVLSAVVSSVASAALAQPGMPPLGPPGEEVGLSEPELRSRLSGHTFSFGRRPEAVLGTFHADGTYSSTRGRKGDYVISGNEVCIRFDAPDDRYRCMRFSLEAEHGLLIGRRPRGSWVRLFPRD